MRTRAAATAIIAATAVVAQAGCDGGGHDDAPKAGSSPARSSASASPSPSVRYTAEQLKRALVEPPARATNVKSESGTADTVLSRLGEPGPSATVTTAPGCPAYGPAGRGAVGRTPVAFLSFSRDEMFFTVLLSASSDARTSRFVTQALPKACRSFKTNAGGTATTATIVADDPYAIGEGGRVRETDETSSGVRLRVWEVAFVGAGYFASCQVGGLNATRAEAERLARQTYRKAGATLH
ncbi:hypothetical protein GCM10023196_032900 [Actinoallomurus vinaceus]|uniref:PknH-like extracellular domain-containing protein n=1 Tax=Actinoallomurus vinaceus TaxID=1080074 RepID=A0ABP8UAU4_9ACTN